MPGMVQNGPDSRGLFDSLRAERSERDTSGTVSSEAIEIVRLGYEAYQSEGIEGIIPILDPAVEWRNPPDSPIAGVFHGHEGVREWQRLADESFDEMDFRPRELIEASDGRVLAICDARVRGRGARSWSRCLSRTWSGCAAEKPSPSRCIRRSPTLALRSDWTSDDEQPSRVRPSRSGKSRRLSHKRVSRSATAAEAQTAFTTWG